MAIDLIKALRFSQTDCLAFTGAGGKTAALFQLARQLIPPVLVTTTTHLGLEQAAFADRHTILHAAGEMDRWLSNLPEGVLLLTKGKVEENRWRGLDDEMMRRLYNFARQRGLPLLIEADGSRRKPLKAPAVHEPCIPPFVEKIVVLAGLSALGKPLDAEWVHRPQIFGRLAGLELGSPITPEALVQVLAHPKGGLKGLDGARLRVLLLNQASTPFLQAQAHRMAERLLDSYHSVIVAAIGDRARERETASAGLSTGGVLAVHERVAGIVLAGGGSTRFGRPKQLLEWRGQAFVRWVAGAALSAGLSPVIVVTGACHEQVAAAIQDLPVRAVYNPEWEAGQSTSLRTGLAGVPPEAGAAIFCLVDQPQIPDTLLRSLVAQHASGLAPIVAPLVEGRRANPVLFDRQVFDHLRHLRGDTGGRALFQRFPVSWLEWQDARILFDVDTEEDYRRLIENT